MGANGWIYTAYHVIAGKKDIKAVFPDKREVPLAWVVALHPYQDWVAFHSTETSRLAFSMGDATEVGAKVVVIGSPRGLEQTITEGLMSGKRTVGATSLLQVSAAVSPGSSGSPLFDQYGDVIGLVSSKLGESEQLTFAVPVSSFRNKIGVAMTSIAATTPGDQPGTGVAVRSPEDFRKEYLRWLLGNSSKLDPAAGKLAAMDSVQLRIFLNDNAKRHISESELEAHVRSVLGGACPRLTIVSSSEATERYKDVLNRAGDETPFQRLIRSFKEWDTLVRSMDITIDSLNSDPTSCYTVRTTVRRGATGTPGQVLTDAFSEGAFGLFGSRVDIAPTWRDAVARQVRSFAVLWEQANPEVK